MLVLETCCRPPFQTSAISRQAILELLLPALDEQRVVLVRAPAGYGKTTTMAQLHACLATNGRRLAWLSLGEFDGTWQEACRYLRRVLGAVCSAPLTEPLEMLPREQAVAALSNALSSTPQPITVFLDDFHALAGSDAEQFFGGFFRRDIGATTWVVGTRRGETEGFAKLRCADRLLEIDGGHLKFSVQEAACLLRLPCSDPAAALLIESAYQKTEGWVAGLRLVSIAMQRGADRHAMLERLSGQTHVIAAFFQEEVFDHLEPAMQSFLLHTSVLGTICPALCDSVTQSVGSLKMLKAIDSMGLFIFSLDSEQRWFRYHDLFSDFLLRLLGDRHPALEPVLHDRASRWFEREGFVLESIQHAFKSGNVRRAATLLQSDWQFLSAKGWYATAVRMAEAIPAHVLDEFPELQLWNAWYVMCERRLDLSEDLIDRVGKKVDELLRAGRGDEARVQDLQRQVLHKRLLHAYYSDSVTKVDAIQRQLVGETGRFDSPIQCTIEVALIYSHREQFHFRGMETLIARARSMAEAPGWGGALLLWHCCAAGPALVMQGKTKEADSLYTQSIELARQMVTDSADLRAMPTILHAELMTEMGRFSDARKLFSEVTALGAGVGTVDHLIALYVTQARLEFFNGDAVKSTALLDAGFAVAATKSLVRLRLSVVLERIRQAALMGDRNRVRDIAREENFAADGDAFKPGQNVTTVTEISALAWSRVAMASGKYDRAINQLRQWVTFGEAHGVITAQLRANILLARAYSESGNLRAAVRAFREAIRLASATGLVFNLLEECGQIKELLKHVRQDESEKYAFILDKLYARVSIRSVAVHNSIGIEGHRPEAASDAESRKALTGREAEILEYVSKSLLNKEIADRLGLTEGSVKWYMQSIYSKLGVRRRMAALDKARALGYLH